MHCPLDVHQLPSRVPSQEEAGLVRNIRFVTIGVLQSFGARFHSPGTRDKIYHGSYRVGDG